MKRFLKYFVSKELLVPLLIILALSMIVVTVFSAKVKGFKEIKRKFWYYALIDILVTGIFFLIIYNLKQTAVMFRFFALEIFFLIIGSIHVYLYRKVFKSLKTDKILTETLFALLISFFATIPIIFLIVYNKDNNYLIDFFIPLIAFILPTLVYRFYETSVSIPMALYNKWYYPTTKVYEDAGINEFKNTIVLDLYFYKKAEDTNLTKFKVKAPRAMNFGRLFYFFVKEYNEKHLGNQISLFDTNNTPYGWYFFLKPNWYGKTKRIDTELSVENNNLHDKMSIICQRIENKNNDKS